MKKILACLLFLTIFAYRSQAQVTYGLGFGAQLFNSTESVNYKSFPTNITPEIDAEICYSFKDSLFTLSTGMIYYNRYNNNSDPSVWINENIITIPLSMYFNFHDTQTVMPSLGVYSSFPISQKHFFEDNKPVNYEDTYSFPYIKFGISGELLFFIINSNKHKLGVGVRATYESDKFAINSQRKPSFYNNSISFRIISWK